MKKFTLLLTAILSICLVSSCSGPTGIKTSEPVSNNADSLSELFRMAGVIKIYEPLRYLIGETDSAHSYYEISLLDIQKYHGKVCPGIASGFFMFQDVLKQLYPDGQIPVRGQIAVACSNPNDMMDVAGYILGIRNNIGRGELGHGLLVLDTSLQTHRPKQFVMIFRRLDNGHMVKVTYNKFKIFDTQHEWSFIDESLHKFKHGELNGEQLKKFQEIVHAKVEYFLKNRVKVYDIEPCTGYKFPGLDSEK